VISNWSMRILLTILEKYIDELNTNLDSTKIKGDHEVSLHGGTGGGIMYILCLKERKRGRLCTYKVTMMKNTYCCLSEVEDAERFAGLLEADDFPQLVTVEVDAESHD
jgi:hypothetical protein